MRIVRTQGGSVEIRGEVRVGSAALIGALFIALPVAFWVASESPMTAERWAALGALDVIGLALIWLGVSRPERLAVKLDPLQVEVDGVRHPVEPGGTLRLEGAPTLPAPTASAYSVSLRGGDGRGWTVLHGREPARVLSECLRLSQATGLPIETGWGLIAGATSWPLQPSTLPDRGVEPQAISDDAEAIRRKIALVALLGALGAAGVFGLEIRGRVLLGETPTVLSVVLSLLCVAVLIVFGAFVGTWRETLTATGEHLVYERRVFGLAISKIEIPLRDVVAAYWVRSTKSRQHLLLDTAKGPLAVPRGSGPDPELAAAIASGRIRECWRLPPNGPSESTS